jgi:hypothetical protein
VAEEEYDWSVAGIISQPKWSMAGRIMNASFSLLVFASQFAMIALVATLLVFVASFCHFLHQRTQWNIVPNPKDGDQRRGFQIFEEPISHLLVAAFLVLAMLYLSIIQNHYLRTSHEHIDVFVKDDILLGATRGLDENPKEFIQRLIDTRPSKLRPNVKNFSRAADLLGGFLIVSFVFGLPLWILRGVAQSGKALLERQGGHRPFNMVFWPLGYVSVSLYLILCILAVLSLLYYRIGLFVFGLLILVAVARIMRIAQQSISAGSNP